MRAGFRRSTRSLSPTGCPRSLALVVERAAHLSPLPPLSSLSILSLTLASIDLWQAELLRVDSDGLTAIGLAAERGLDELSVGLETAVLLRLHALVEVVYAPTHQAHAQRLAEAVHGYWPQLDVRIHSHRATEKVPRCHEDETLRLCLSTVSLPHFSPPLSDFTFDQCVIAQGTPRASPFDVLWIERWGGSRSSSVVYTHLVGQHVDQPLPAERAVWKELSLRIDGPGLLL